MKGLKRVIEKERKEFNGLILKMVTSKNIGLFFLVIALIAKKIVNKLNMRLPLKLIAKHGRLI